MATVQSDDVYPLHLLDSIPDVFEHTPVVLMRFNDVLHADKLHAALVKLLSNGDWRKLAGRLRKDTSGGLEAHVPRTFTQQRPAVRYTHNTFDLDIGEHSLGSQLPVATAQPSLQHSSSHFAEFCWEPGAPGHLVDYLNSDEPPVALRITSFRDATLVAVSWSHVMMDALGLRDLLSAWCQVLARHEDEVPPVLGARDDVARQIWENESPIKEPYMWESKMLTGLSFLWFALRFVWQLLWQRKVGARTLFLPAHFVTQLRQEAEAEAQNNSFVSDGDILSAWIARLMVSVNGWSGPVTVLNVVDLRSRVPSVFKRTGIYLQNLTMPSLAFLDTSKVLASPLGAVAAEIRQSLSAQTTEPQVRAIYRLAIPHVKRNGRAPPFGDRNSNLVPISNWSKAKFIETVDFGPAVIRTGREEPERRSPPGTMVYQITSQVKQSAMIRNTAVIIGKDYSGNYWINLYIAEALFDPVKKYVDGLVL
jgi:hypothetical protein